MRAMTVAQHLQELRLAPVIFAQGALPRFVENVIPSTTVGTVYKQDLQRRTTITEIITSFARLSDPAMVIDDTHPTPIYFPRDIRRLLLVRPTSCDYLRHIKREYERTYEHFAICDHPDSPTWPYSVEDTRAILSWDRWSCIGPIYRVSGTEDRNAMLNKLDLGPDSHLYIFSMGGGGVQKQSTGDIAAFLEAAKAIADRIRLRDDRARLLFVRGPLFPPEVVIPDIFDEISVEDDMPALFSVATGAVIRPGFNSVWECISGSTPFIPVHGVTFAEPSSERIHRLVATGLLNDDIDVWSDPTFVSEHRRLCTEACQTWSPRRATAQLLELILHNPNDHRAYCPIHRDKNESSRGATFTTPSYFRFPLLIRIDDVTSVDGQLTCLLNLCSTYKLKVSLEVIPYLCTTDEGELGRLYLPCDFEVSQHGYAHIPRQLPDGKKCEFVARERCERDLVRGKQLLQERFPNTFRGGLSAPFDAAPVYVSQCWKALDGRYISTCHEGNLFDLPTIQLIDPWNWLVDKPFSESAIIAGVKRSITTKGYAGVVLHPRLIARKAQEKGVESLISILMDMGGRPALLSRIATAQADLGARISNFLDHL